MLQGGRSRQVLRDTSIICRHEKNIFEINRISKKALFTASFPYILFCLSSVCRRSRPYNYYLLCCTVLVTQQIIIIVELDCYFYLSDSEGRDRRQTYDRQTIVCMMWKSNSRHLYVSPVLDYALVLCTS